MVNAYTAHWGDITVDNLEQILSSISYLGNRQYEIVFSAGMIERICAENQYPCYRFAHDLDGNPYIRARIDRITLEFLVISKKENPNEKQSLVLQINNKGQRIYSRPEKPTATSYVKDY